MKTRKFTGKAYYNYGGLYTKKNANSLAKKIRKTGKKARVVSAGSKSKGHQKFVVYQTKN